MDLFDTETIRCRLKKIVIAMSCLQVIESVTYIGLGTYMMSHKDPLYSSKLWIDLHDHISAYIILLMSILGFFIFILGLIGAQKEHFDALLSQIILISVVIFSSFGALCFGKITVFIVGLLINIPKITASIRLLRLIKPPVRYVILSSQSDSLGTLTFMDLSSELRA
ncbi:hypothetical protein CHUAL_001299 [Chamberlinius hualienensis]